VYVVRLSIEPSLFSVSSPTSSNVLHTTAQHALARRAHWFGAGATEDDGVPGLPKHAVTGGGAAYSPDNAHRDSPNEVILPRDHHAPVTFEQSVDKLATCRHAEQHVYGRDKRDSGAHCVFARQECARAGRGSEVDAYEMPKCCSSASARRTVHWGPAGASSTPRLSGPTPRHR
jgi:hypothetical protein